MIVLGRITAPYGVRGWVKVKIYGDDPASLARMPCWWSCEREAADDAAWQARALAQCKAYGGGLIVRFAGIEDRDAAQGLAGLFVGAPRGALPATSADEYYWADLVGLEVANLAGEPLGRVVGLLRGAAHEVLVVQAEGGGRRLLPFVAAVVKRVDLAGRRIEVDWEPDW
jgi:16S rRNA processing protein RimM